MEIALIHHGSSAYHEMTELRMEILRRPLGLSFTPGQLAEENKDWLVGAYEERQLMACCVLTHHNASTLQLRQMAVRQDMQSKGYGRKLLHFSEQLAKENGYRILMMHARKVATPFYEKCGYKINGNEFTEVGIPHYLMQKEL